MIIPKLYGRLGNQCYQIAAAIAHAKAMGTNWRVPYRSLNPNVWPTYFNNLPVARGAVTMHTYKEKRHCYDPIPNHSDLTIDGYFQSEKYFENAKQEVRDALGFDLNNGGGYVAVHVRRGDYLQYPDQFPVLANDYYTKAQDYFFGKMVGRFMIYSDDLDWCKKQFNGIGNEDVEFCTISDPLAAMRHMYNADAFIIANSTFSLFPATLRDDVEVVAPAEHRWYGPKNSHLETFDLMPKRFIQI